MDKLAEKSTIGYKVSYAWTSIAPSFGSKQTPDKIFCAWCKKSQAEIAKTEDLNTHIENHDKEDKKVG